jgi:hypothetical protein
MKFKLRSIQFGCSPVNQHGPVGRVASSVFLLLNKYHNISRIFNSNLNIDGIGSCRHRWEDNIKMDPKEIGCEELNWIHVAQVRGTSGRFWQTQERIVNLQVP